MERGLHGPIGLEVMHGLIPLLRIYMQKATKDSQKPEVKFKNLEFPKLCLFTYEVCLKKTQKQFLWSLLCHNNHEDYITLITILLAAINFHNIYSKLIYCCHAMVIWQVIIDF